MYLEIDEGYPGHRKTLRLCALLKCDTADAYPPRLWAWAARSAPDGDLTGMDAVELELALRWRGVEGALFTALVRAGFVDQDSPDGPTVIHNWATRTGGAIEKMAARAGMAKERRAHVDGKCVAACRYCAGTLTLRSPARSNQDKTSQDQSSDSHSPAFPASETGSDPRSEGDAKLGSRLTPNWGRYKMPFDVTEAFAEVFARYPNQNGQAKAASAWCAIVEAGFAGGEPALREAIVARWDSGQLTRHPYAGDAKYRPAFETYLREFRWLDADSAPDDVVQKPSTKAVFYPRLSRSPT